MKKAILLTICLLLGAFAGNSFAVEVTMFGPSQYVRTSGAPDIYTDSVEAIQGTGMLIVKNGQIDGNDRIIDVISSATVLVNGVQIFGASDFNKNVYLLEGPINLTEINSITVELASQPGSFLTIEVIQHIPLPTVIFNADPADVILSETSTLTWTSTGSDSCVIEPGIGSVNVNGSISVSPTETTTYTIIATNRGGTASDSITVTVYQPPTVSLKTAPETILLGESSTLTWASTNADSALIDQGVGTVAVDGATTVSPTETTTYTITVTGAGGTATASVTVNVTYPVPTVSISANPNVIQLGETAALSWASTDADSCVIDQGIGIVDPTGSLALSPNETTTYSITATGPGGTVTGSVTVTVVNPPSISIIEPDGLEDNADTTYTIQWNDMDSDDNATISLFYDTDIGGADGTLIVSGLSEDPDGGDDAYVWDTTEIAEGTYYIYAVIDDGENDPVVDYSAGVLNIVHAVPDEIKLTVNDAAAEDHFGRSVSVSGDYAIVGAPHDDDGGYSSGSAYIFKRNGFTFTEQAKLTAGDGAEYDYFGYSVAISGDYAVVGAYGDDDSGESSGSAYIFKREGDTWTEHAKLTAGDASSEDYFGYSVAISGDYAIVGAYGDDDGGESSGSAYIFKREGIIWIEQAKLTAGDAANGDYFGHSVSIDGESAIVGAYGKDDGGSESGAAYVFGFDGTVWVKQGKLTASDAEAYDYFGYSVAISGNHAIIGAYGDDDEGIDSGAAYIFSSSSPWAERTKLTGGNAGADGRFGYFVTISPISDGFYSTVGAPGYSSGGGSSGVVQMFGGYESTWTPQTILTANNPSPDDQFGTSVSASDGSVIVGAFGTDDVGSDSGSAYVYPVSTVDIYADPEIILIGESSTLSWVSKNSNAVNIDQGIGTVAPVGTRTVSPQQTTTYAITAIGPNGTSTDNVTIHVVDPSLPPSVSISTDLTEINPGDSINLSWSSANANTCIIEPYIGNVNFSGSLSISPTQTTTYTITASNPGGAITDSVTVSVVISAPTVTIFSIPVPLGIRLYWSSTNAQSCVIEPDIGAVTLNGSIFISPLVTTTYTITATGPAGTATATVTVPVIPVGPTVTISAMPGNIQYGQSATLSWSSTAAETCVIEPGIGPVNVSGSMTVSPTETTNYTITATGPGGTATGIATVTVTHPAPTVSISATPHSIQHGQTTTLTWSSENATFCVIQPEVGEVGLNGSVELSPTQTTSYMITATGLGGTAIATAMVTVTSVIDIAITSPFNSETVNKPFFMVKGTLSNDLGLETGLIVNGKVAMVYGNEFVANHVPLKEGSNTITAYAIDTQGNTSEASIAINAIVNENYVKLQSGEYEGVEPFETTLTVEASFEVTEVSLSYVGPGTVEVLDMPSSSEYVLRMTGTGVYYFIAEVTDSDNNIYEDKIGIVVLDEASMDALLKAKWNGMKTALGSGDIEGGLKYFMDRSKDRYSTVLNLLVDQLPALVAEMQDIERIYIHGRIAKYRSNRLHNIDGESVNITYYIYFVKDRNGLWWIDQY